MAPRFSIIIPVIHEEAGINAAIEHLGVVRQDESLEIIVVDGDREGTTLKVIRDRNVITSTSETGRARQMNKGAVLAKGEVFVFFHADTRLPAGVFQLIDAALRDPSYPAGAFDLRIDSAWPAFRLIEKISSFRSRLTRIPYGDQALFFRRDQFNAIGGFADIPLMEDVEIMRRLKKKGIRIKIIDQPVTTSARRWEKEGILKCTLRNWLLISLYLTGISPERLVKFYK